MTVKVAIAQINSIVGDLAANSALIFAEAQKAHAQACDILITPELSLVGYPPEDLLLRSAFYAQSYTALKDLIAQCAHLTDLHVIVGLPIQNQHGRFNAAVVFCNGQIVGQYHKHSLPNETVFDEKRYFSSGNEAFVFAVKGTQFGINICEDTWNSAAPLMARQAGAQVLLALNASPFHANKNHLRCEVMREHVSQHGMSLVYANLIGGQDELIFDGNSFVMNAQGEITTQLRHAQSDFEVAEFQHGVPQVGRIETSLSFEAQIYQVLVLGVRDYVNKNGFPSTLIGFSGGVDSALTLAIAVDALGAERVRTVMMASPYTAEISWLDCRDMVQRLGVRYDEIAINECFQAFRGTLANEFAGLKEDTTEENIQARIRGTLLMALSNKYGSIVLTTGNKSEMAVGYCTLYGDMAGGFAVIKDVAKTLVYRLCAYRNSLSEIIPERILTRPPSAELRPDQKDQDSLPDYAILDGIMQRYMEENQSRSEIIAAGYDAADVEKITRLIKLNEYKRRQAPVGIRITHRAFGRDWRYPITSKFRD